MSTPAPASTHRLATFASAIQAADLPPAVRHAAARLLLDTVGCMLGGTATEAGRLGHEWAIRSQSGGPATVVGFGSRTSAMLAAYANGRLAAVLDADETYPGARQVSHLAAATVAAALACAEVRAVDGATLLAAIVAGYEVGARVSNAMIPALAPGSRGLRAGWGPGSVLGATAAAGRVLGLSPATLAHALGLAGSHVDPPPLQWTDVRPAPMAKSADAGWHALAAVVAAEQAAIGLTGYDTILDGENGLWRALGYAGSDEAALTDRLGERWIVLDAAFKRWPCQYWMHPALTALHRVIEAQPVRADAIERIVLATNEKSLSAKFHDPEPPGEIDRAFSFPHAAAMLVLGVPPGPAWFDEAVAATPAARRLRGLVQVTLHPDAPRFPEWVVEHQIRDLPASASVVTRHGTASAEVRLGLGAPWSDESRLSDRDLGAKFRDLAADVLPADPGRPDRLQEAVDGLLHAGDASDVRALLALVTPSAPADAPARSTT
jgi:2-methylcitrate dehydratase PrpD